MEIKLAIIACTSYFGYLYLMDLLHGYPRRFSQTNQRERRDPNFDGEAEDVFAQISERFAWKLLVSAIVGPVPGSDWMKSQWREKKLHVERFLDKYYSTYGEFPSGEADLGKTEFRRIEIGEIDFNAIKSRISAELREKARISKQIEGQFRLAMWVATTGRRLKLKGPAIKWLNVRYLIRSKAAKNISLS